MKKLHSLLVALAACTILAPTDFMSAPVEAAEFFVSPDGTPQGTGTREAPWSWTTALAHPPAVQPGDVIWLRGGTYSGNVACKLQGLPGKWIVVRQALGERATIDCRSVDGKPTTFNIDGDHVMLQDFEITNSDPRRTTEQSGSWPTDLYRGGIFCRASGAMFVNLVVHDVATGLALWSEGEGGGVYGCLIYNCGWRAPDRGHGHGIYTQNVRGTKTIEDNFIFNQFGYGIHAYGSSKAKLEGYRIAGNAVFNNGILVGDGSRTANMLVGGGAKAARIEIDGNFSYHTGLEQTGLQIGYGPQSVDLVMRDNYIAGFMRMMSWERAMIEGNTFVGKSSMVELNLGTFDELAGFNWNKNRYLSGEERFAPFAAITPKERTIGRWNEWRTRTGFDSQSTYEKGPPRGVQVFVNPSRWEPGRRANIVVFNWDKAETVDVALGINRQGWETLRPGTKYKIVSATNFYGPPIAAGTYDGTPIKLSMKPRPAPPPIGLKDPTPPTEPEFGAFVLLREEN